MTQLLRLPARIAAEEAVRHFMRPRLANLYGLRAKPINIAAPSDPSGRVPPFVERLWMPAYAVRFRTLTQGKTGSVWTAVDGWVEQFSLFECCDELDSREVLEDFFPPGVDEKHAIDRARKGLMQYILRRRGQMNKPIIEDVEESKLYYYPLWVLYFRRRRSLDLKVLDGYTGKPAGPKLRLAVVQALIADRQNRQAIQPNVPNS